MTIDTDWIAGYVDGTLDPDRRRLVEDALERDPTLAAALRRERDMAALLSAAFPPVEEPLPPALATLLAPRPMAPAAPRRRPAARWLGRIAAAAALLAIIGGGWTALRVIDRLENRMARLETAEQLRLTTRTAITTGRAEVLERSPNGTEMPWNSGDGTMTGRVKPVSTFVDGTGRFCREFIEAIDGPDGRRTGGGIACRVGQRDWRLWWPGGGDNGQAL